MDNSKIMNTNLKAFLVLAVLVFVGAMVGIIFDKNDIIKIEQPKPNIFHDEALIIQMEKLTNEVERLNDSIDQAKIAYAAYQKGLVKQLNENKKFTDRLEEATDEEKINLLGKKYPWMIKE